MNIEEQYFICRTCYETKIWKEFKKKKKRKYGIEYICNKCQHRNYDPEKNKEYYRKRLERLGKTVTIQDKRLTGESNPYKRGTTEYNKWNYAKHKAKIDKYSIDKFKEKKQSIIDARLSIFKESFPNATAISVRGAYCDCRKLRENQICVGIGNGAGTHIIITLS